MKEILKRMFKVCIVMLMSNVVITVLNMVCTNIIAQMFFEFDLKSILLDIVIYLIFTYYMWSYVFKDITKNIFAQVGFVLLSLLLVPIFWIIIFYIWSVMVAMVWYAFMNS